VNGLRYRAAVLGFAPVTASQNARRRWVPRSLRSAEELGWLVDAGSISVAPTDSDERRGGTREGISLSWATAAHRGADFFHAMKTYVANSSDRERNWLLVDANGQTLGRLATQIADALRGKRKPTYTPHVDTGDFVIVINAEKISVSGNKRQEKRYYRHSGYPGGLRSRTLEEMLNRRPEEVIRLAVKGMLPRNRLARKQITKLKIYAGPEHPHVAQQPQPMEIETS
jgi:large subunit ribosomal protein L13